jgi:two-component sensor histidine kinase
MISADAPPRILIADDNPDDRALVVRELSRQHPAAELHPVGAPGELEAVLASGPVTLAVVDYSLGWTNGLELLDRLRGKDPDCPVVLFSGSIGDEGAADAIKSGFDDFVLKSVARLPRLSASVAALLKQRADRKARRRAEARYQALLESTTVALFACRRDGRFENGNEALLRLLCIGSVEELRGRSILEFAGSAAVLDAWQRMTGGAAGGIGGIEVELNGCPEPRWALLDAHPADEARTQIEGVMTDVTRLRGALDERNALLGEVHHRVHNNLQIVQSLLAFQARRFSSSEVRAAFDEVGARIHTLSLVQQQLYQAEDYSAVDFGAYLETLVGALLRLRNRAELKSEFDLEPIRLPINKAMPLGLIANELLTNTLKHAFPDGRAGVIRVGFKREGDRAVLTVSDNGVGVSLEPQESEGDGLGSRLVPRLARQLGAEIATQSDGGYATRVSFGL